MKTLDLNGSWRVRWSDGQRGRPEYAQRDVTDAVRYLDAQVPGEIHLDLMRAGIIADPSVGTNCLAARWVEECVWSYRRVFDASAAACRAKKAWLVFDQLDLAGQVVLNGKTVAEHANVFLPLRVDVTGALRASGNVLAVHVEGGLYHAAEKPCDGFGMGKDGSLHKRVWLRKPQCQFSWDWSTRLINVGITGGVRLEWTDEPVRLEAFVPLATVSDDLATGRVRGRFILEGLSAADAAVTLALELEPAGRTASAAVTVKPGVNAYEVALTVEAPELWWPAGAGRQALSTVRGRVRCGRKVIAESVKRIGFRKIAVRQPPHEAGGRAFILSVNNRDIFVKGGNYVPADMIFARIDRSRTERLTALALEANFNMLRVWGGGLYESDDFYDLCDERGILVWQEFIFACGKFPAHDRAFYESVQAEARHQVRRLAGRASLAVWCGNNEMEWGAWAWGYDRAGLASTDYHLFHLALPRILKEEDGTRYYQPSSPYSPDGEPPNADHLGDQHPWSVGFQDTDFRKYRQMACRFPNEGGILGPNALPTVLACLPEGQRQVQSFAWQVHDNSVDSWAEPSPCDAMVSQWLGKNIRALSIEEWVYWGGLLHGEGLREYCENFRRRMFDSASAIFWMYNDCWPTVRSWTIVDYGLRRTPAFHPVRRALQPVHVVIVEEAGEVRVYGVNDTARAVSGTLEYGVFTLDGRYPVRLSAAVELLPNASTVVARFSAARWKNRRATMPFAVLRDGDGVVRARNRLFAPLFKEMKWAKPKVTVRLEGREAVFQSAVFVWGVCLDLDGDAPLADNFFDLYPGIPYRIPWRGKQPPQVLRCGNL